MARNRSLTVAALYRWWHPGERCANESVLLSRDRKGVPMARSGPPVMMKVASKRVSLWGGGNGRGRLRSGSVEAVREFDLGHAREPINVRCFPGGEAVSRNGALQGLRALRFHAGESNDDNWQCSGNRRS